MGDDSSTATFRHLLADQWEYQLQDDPLFATWVGDHRYDHLLPHVREADFARRIERLHGFHARLESIPRDDLSPSDQLNHDLFGRELHNRTQWMEFRAYRMPISRTSGFHSGFPDLFLEMPFNTVREYENYIARLSAFREYAGEYVEIMREGLRGGQVPARVTLEGVDDTVRTQIVEDPTKSPLDQPFAKFPPSIPTEECERLREAGRRAILTSVVGGYSGLLRFVLDEYLPSARSDIAAASLPDGRAYYASCIYRHTTLELAPERIHEIGMSEVKRIRAEMEALIRKTGFQGTFREFIEYLRADPRFYATTPDALMKETAYVLKRIDGELPRLFKTLPRTPYGIRAIPDFKAPGNTTAYYDPPAGDGTKAGFYYVNLYDLKSRPLYEIEALSLHEAVPGHHLQLALQQELGDLPPFRRFTHFTAFIEGWALYAERLGLEIGFFQDPYSDFARLSYEMWRACRLVVDTGMHALGWTRQRAIDFMAENTSSTLLNITNEVDRYIAWPGQALAYKMGELKIRELRGAAEKALRPRFDIREFHDVVLRNGAIPLDLLEDIAMQWIEEQRGAGTPESPGAPGEGGENE